MAETTTRRSDAPTIKTGNTDHTDNLYGTDRRAAQNVALAANDHERTDIKVIRVNRYGEVLKIKVKGTVALSYSSIHDNINTDVYTIKDIMVYSTGNVTVKLSTR